MIWEDNLGAHCYTFFCSSCIIALKKHFFPPGGGGKLGEKRFYDKREKPTLLMYFESTCSPPQIRTYLKGLPKRKRANNSLSPKKKRRKRKSNMIKRGKIFFSFSLFFQAVTPCKCKKRDIRMNISQ